jgi:hypothetical protein
MGFLTPSGFGMTSGGGVNVNALNGFNAAAMKFPSSGFRCHSEP